MIRKIYLFLLVISFTIAVSAQVNGNLYSLRQGVYDSSNNIIRIYMDSLISAKNRIFNETNLKGATYKGDNFQLAKLFLLLPIIKKS